MMSIKEGCCEIPMVDKIMDTSGRWTPGESWPSTYRCLLEVVAVCSRCDAMGSYAQYVPIGYRLLAALGKGVQLRSGKRRF
jgi:hypothetical protein